MLLSLMLRSPPVDLFSIGCISTSSYTVLIPSSVRLYTAFEWVHAAEAVKMTGTRSILLALEIFHRLFPAHILLSTDYTLRIPSKNECGRPHSRLGSSPLHSTRHYTGIEQLLFPPLLKARSNPCSVPESLWLSKHGDRCGLSVSGFLPAEV